MALAKRHAVLIARLAAVLGVLLLRGPKRFLGWPLHDFLWLYPTLMRNCQWHGEVVTRFETSEREVWLTIDDGPDPRDTPDMLALLAERQARATFFVIGKKVEAHRDLTRRIVAEGHSLGNHTQSHPAGSWWLHPRPLVRREISAANQSLLVATGAIPPWFRSPVGMNNSSIHPVLATTGQRAIGWTASGGDGCPATPTRIVERIMAGVEPGAIILLHESGHSRHRLLTLARLLDRLAAEGYRCVLPPETALR